MDWRSERRANLVVILALLAGAAAFFFALCAFGVVALYAGLIKIWIINPVPEPFPWVMPTIVGVSVLFAIFVVWWTLRLPRSGSMFGGR
jgi:hypothetical protein